jgi:hypothetical protein
MAIRAPLIARFIGELRDLAGVFEGKSYKGIALFTEFSPAMLGMHAASITVSREAVAESVESVLPAVSPQ